MFTKQKVFFIWWAAGMLHIVCILEPYLTYGTWHNWVTQNCTQRFAGPCKLEGRLINEHCLAIHDNDPSRQ